MGQETVNYGINDLVVTNPVDATDIVRYGAYHLRAIKTAVKYSFAGFTGSVLVTATDSGAADAYVLNPSTAIPAYKDRMLVLLVPANTNATTTPTLNVSSLGAKTIVSCTGGAVLAQDLVASRAYLARYDLSTDKFWLLSPTKNYIDSLAFNTVLPSQPGTSRKYFLRTQNGTASWELLGIMDRRSVTGADTVGLADVGNLVDCSGTFTLAFAATATLGDEATGYIQNSGTGDVTLDPNGSETIDGLTSYVMHPGEVRKWYVEGSAIKTIVVHPFYRAFTTSGTFTKPPGYNYFCGRAWSGGCSGQRTNNTATLSVGGAGGGCADFMLPASVVGTTETVTIGAGGNAVTGVANGNVGGSTSIGSLFTVAGSSSFTAGGAINSTLIGRTSGNNSFGFESSAADTAGRSTVWGGSNPSNDASANSGNSVFGGAAGGSVNAAGTLRNPGTSIQGGNGGAASIASNGTDGTAPGGGGGATQTGTQSGAGARGELRIWGVV